nr:unnamed protein product [Digitaria exilis]
MAMAPPLAGVVRLAAASRVLVLALSLLSRLLFRPYDTSATLHPPCLSSSATPSTSAPSTNLSAAISSLAVWDGVHFARPAECGYEYEQSYAFLPLLPASIALLPRSLFAPLVPVLGYGAVLVLSGLVLNNVAFVASAAYFYRLSVLILKDRKAAYRASVLFCFNPASVFYSSLYSESLYALFSLGGLFYLFSGANTVAVIMLAISSSARSNGALNAGYFCFQALLRAYDAAVNKKRPLGSWFLEILPSQYVLFIIKASLYVDPSDSIAKIPTSVPLMKVSTRFLSASPPIYWAAAHILASPNCTSKRWGYLICAYFIAYILLGSLLFSNFYPFT